MPWTREKIEFAYDEGRLTEEQALDLLHELYEVENEEDAASLEESTD